MSDFGQRPRVTIAQIKAEVCQEFGVTLGDMALRQTRASRTQHVSRARQVAMYLARRILREKVVVLAMMFGLRDHTTVVISVKRISARIAVDPFLALRVTALEARLQSPELVEHY